METDFTLRLGRKVREWNTQRQKDIGLIAHEAHKRRNSSYYYRALVEYEVKHTNERAEWSYQTCCEIWEIQGQKKSHAFLRAVFDGCLTPLFATRRSVIIGEVQLRVTRLREIGGQPTAILRSFAMEMDRLRADWNVRLEIESRNNDYRMQLAREREFREQKDRLQEDRQISAVSPLRQEIDAPMQSVSAAPNRILSIERSVKPPKAPLQRYKSEFKRQVSILLGRNPNSSTLEICRALDDDGAMELPSNWSGDSNTRLFAVAYMVKSVRPKIDKAVSKIRADFRENGML